MTILSRLNEGIRRLGYNIDIDIALTDLDGVSILHCKKYESTSNYNPNSEVETKSYLSLGWESMWQGNR